jgi:hypothetical protein
MMPKLTGIFSKTCCVCQGITWWPFWPLTATSLRSHYNPAGEVKSVHQGRCRHRHEQSALWLPEGEEARQAVRRRIAYENHLCCVCGKDGGCLIRRPLHMTDTLPSAYNPECLPSWIHRGDCNSRHLTSHREISHQQEVATFRKQLADLRRP